MLRQAVHAIAALGTIEAVSPVYATAPIGFAAQPDFWNVVVRIRTRLNPVALLDAVKAVEVRLGRTPRFRDGPREIDIDVLQYDGGPASTDASARVRAAAAHGPGPRPA
jgi:2-amino-4-hydroxy-6-hydroxymethyldihydropteridine diphosphokinase